MPVEPSRVWRLICSRRQLEEVRQLRRAEELAMINRARLKREAQAVLELRQMSIPELEARLAELKARRDKNATRAKGRGVK